MNTQHFFIEDASFGSTPRRELFRSGQPTEPLGLAFFCSACTRLWAIAPIEGRESHAIHLPCSRHPGNFPSLYPSGSLWTEHDDDFVLDLPLSVLKREFEIHLNWLNKKLSGSVHAGLEV